MSPAVTIIQLSFLAVLPRAFAPETFSPYLFGPLFVNDRPSFFGVLPPFRNGTAPNLVPTGMKELSSALTQFFTYRSFQTETYRSFTHLPTGFWPSQTI